MPQKWRTQCDWLQAARKYRGVPRAPSLPAVPFEDFQPVPAVSPELIEPEPAPAPSVKPAKPGRKKKTSTTFADLREAGEAWKQSGLPVA